MYIFNQRPKEFSVLLRNSEIHCLETSLETYLGKNMPDVKVLYLKPKRIAPVIGGFLYTPVP